MSATHTPTPIKPVPSRPLVGRALEIFNEVWATRGGFWDAFDQGRAAYADGTPRASNYWLLSAPHVNCNDWFRGWDSEAARAALAKAGA